MSSGVDVKTAQICPDPIWCDTKPAVAWHPNLGEIDQVPLGRPRQECVRRRSKMTKTTHRDRSFVCNAGRGRCMKMSCIVFMFSYKLRFRDLPLFHKASSMATYSVRGIWWNMSYPRRKVNRFSSAILIEEYVIGSHVHPIPTVNCVVCKLAFPIRSDIWEIAKILQLPNFPTHVGPQNSRNLRYPLLWSHTFSKRKNRPKWIDNG